MAKHVVFGGVAPVAKEALKKSAEEKQSLLKDELFSRKKRTEEKLKDSESLINVSGRVVIKISSESKNFHTFENGQTIRRERQYNEFNRRVTEPVNCVVISSDYIPAGSEILIGHNALHEVNKIYDYDKTLDTDVGYYSLPEEDCFAWRDESGELRPMKNFDFAYRVFKPYEGLIAGIEPSVIKEVLYIRTGEFAGNVARCLKASDYEVIFQGKDGREDNVIRCRHFPDEYNEKEELIAIDHDLTDKVNKGQLLVGLSPSDAKTINEWQNQ
jgi:hypothetical protein